jgi:hypothetical protein
MSRLLLCTLARLSWPASSDGQTQMDITLRTVTDAARLRVAAVTAEAAGYLVLLVVQQLVPRPCHVSTDTVLLSEAGDVSVSVTEQASSLAVEIELRQLLAALMSLAHSTTPALRAAAERVGTGDLSAFQGELQAALIPINHAAAHRALARLYREAQRANPGSAPNSSIPQARVVTPTPSIPVEARAVAPTPSAQVETRAVAPSANVLSGPTLDDVIGLEPRVQGLDPQAGDAQAELDIDVDVVDVEGEGGAPAPRPSFPSPVSPAGTLPIGLLNDAPSTPSTLSAPSISAQAQLRGARSEVSQLLVGFLSQTGRQLKLAEDLRKMIGIELIRPATGSVSGAADSPGVAQI